MPSWKIHRLMDKLVLGREYQDVHEFLDVPGTIINGSIKGHRKVWGHSPEYILLTYLLTRGDVDRTLSAWLHIELDKRLNYKKSKLLEYVLSLLLR